MLLLGGMLIGVGVVLALIAAMLFGAAIVADGSSSETLRPRGENRATANGGEGSRPG